MYLLDQNIFAEMAELVDAVDSKSTDRKVVRVRVPFSAPYLRISYTFRYKTLVDVP